MEPLALSVAECCAAVSDVGASSEESLGQGQVSKVKNNLRKLHNNLGHPSTRSPKKLLKNANASETALCFFGRADRIELRHLTAACQTTLPAVPNHFHDFNHRIGWDVKTLPGWKLNQKAKCLNIVDFASSQHRAIKLCFLFMRERGVRADQAVVSERLAAVGRCASRSFGRSGANQHG